MFLPIKKWVDYITSTTTKPNLWFGGDHYCDWLELGAKQGQFIGDTRGDLIGSAFYARSVEILCKAGRIIGEDVSDYELLYGRIIDAFNSEFEGTYKTQTEHALALIFNITKDPESLARSLADLIHKDGVKLQTGFVGTPYILHALSRYGYSELAYTLLLREDYPSWLYPVTKGATTVWEHWDGIMPDGEMWSSGMNSFNHYAYGAVIDWIYATCGGINPIETAPGYEKVLIAPIADKRLEWLSVELQTAHGTISSSWRHEKDKTVYKISTPVSATVVIEGKTYELCAGSYTF
jgi:alpha-L-rhamnosidase